MQKALIYKLLTITGLALLLLIPLALISETIREREFYRDEVIRDISQSWTGSQTITAAVLVAPYTEKIEKEVEIYEEGQKKTIIKEERVQRTKYFLPENLAIKGHINTEERYRGIYKVPVYKTRLKLQGEFKLPKALGITTAPSKITWQKPYIALGIQDIRGIDRAIKLHINKQPLTPRPGTKTSFLKGGVHAFFQPEYYQEQHLEFDADLELRGMEKLSFLPAGKFTTVELSSAWPHPSFVGRFLPHERKVTAEGFTATWQTSFFASNMQQLLNNCINKNQCQGFKHNNFGVSLNQGVDIYLQAERSVKYAILFIGLTFIAFFLFEILKGLPVHAVQYGLVGVALALFYLLLVSLSEHISFVLSYIIASSACVSLLTFYVSFVLRSAIRGLIFGGTLVGLYSALYLLLSSEGYSLFMGSVLLFAVLAFIMAATRRIDWYQLETGTKHRLNINTDKLNEGLDKQAHEGDTGPC